VHGQERRLASPNIRQQSATKAESWSKTMLWPMKTVFGTMTSPMYLNE
jgi:hypothetical protein